MVDGVTTPYSTAAPFLGAPPGWVRAEDAERILAYQLYEMLYWNNDEAYKISSAADDFSAIYIPNGRTIVDTTNRYVAPKFGFSVTAGTGDAQLYGTPEQQTIAQAAFTNLFRRERFLSKFAMNKRYGLMRGDWLWHIVADPEKPEGSRISIYTVDPGSWFPVYDDVELDRMVKVHLVDRYFTEGGDEQVKRLTYEKDDSGLIIMSEAIFKPDEWFKIDGVPLQVVTPPTPLPAEITAFPVYHIPNSEEPANPYGSSELRGLERIIQAVSQAMTDEDLALALEGLGVYATEGGGPVNEDGEDTAWSIYPGVVLENAVGFKRVDGVSNLTPYGDHIGRLISFLREAAATPDVAVGRVDVQVAESGVALLLEMGPMLAKTDEKDQIILDVHTQMFYDLKWWFKVYEGMDFTACEILPTFGDKLPVNVDAEITRATTMVTAGLWSLQTAREELAKKGIHFAPDEDARVIAEQQAATASNTSAIDQRMNQELSTLGGASGAGA